MNTATIQQQYDDIIAPHYDLDPRSVIRNSLEKATQQIQSIRFLESAQSIRALDMGIGTGSFLAMVLEESSAEIRPFGLDISAKMIDIARTKIPNLEAVVDSAANLDRHFEGESFDLICTHFITGFVPMSELAPLIGDRLEVGGYWSLVAGTKAGFPALQEKANSKVFRWVTKSSSFDLDAVTCNPEGRAEVLETLEANHFEIQEIETFEPPLDFANLDEFLAFAHRGGWLTPFIEKMGLHKAGKMLTFLINTFFFPVKDHHSIEIALVQKVAD